MQQLLLTKDHLLVQPCQLTWMSTNQEEGEVRRKMYWLSLHDAGSQDSDCAFQVCCLALNPFIEI